MAHQHNLAIHYSAVHVVCSVKYGQKTNYQIKSKKNLYSAVYSTDSEALGGRNK